jgi:hypothetical protein
MKLKILALLVVALALACAWQWRALRAARSQLSENERILQTEIEGRELQEHKTKVLEQQQASSVEQISQLSGLVAAFRAADANYASNFARLAKQSGGASAAEAKEPAAEPEALFGKGMSGMLGKMMKDPAMKEMMRSQQKSMMGLMYGGLSKEHQCPRNHWRPAKES